MFFFIGLSSGHAQTEISGALKSAAPQAEAIFGNKSRRKIYLGLEECINRAQVFNKELRTFDQDLRKAEAKFQEADIIGRPVFEYENIIAPVPKDVSNAVESFFAGDISVFEEFKVRIGVPVSTFGKIRKAKQLADGGIEAVGYKRLKKESEVIFRVRQLYYGILLARELNRLLDYSLNRAAKEIKKREESDEPANPVEVLKLKLFHNDIAKKYTESKNKEILALEAMRVMLGLDRSQSFDIKQARLAPIRRRLESFEHYQSVALRQRADIKLLQIGLNSRRINYELEKRQFAPDLGFGGIFELGRAPNVVGLAQTDDFTNPLNYTRVALGLRLQGKFDYGTRAAKIRQAKADFRKTRIEVDAATEGIVLEIKKAYIGVKSAQNELKRAEESSKLARQVLFLTQSNFDIGLAESKDLIDAISKFLLTRGEYFKAVFDYNAAFAELDQKLDELPELNS